MVGVSETATEVRVMTKKSKPKVTSADLMEAIRARCSPPAWAVFEQVGNSTGGQCKRWADGIAVSIWPSRGLEIHGFEIKVHRSDWLRELRDPKKADPLQAHCDRWWIVVPDKSVVSLDELPPNWGLLQLAGKQLRSVVPAPNLEPKPLSRGFVAALLRRAYENQEALCNEAKKKGFAAGAQRGPEVHERKLSNTERKLQNLQETVDEFKEASGVDIGLHKWDGGNIGEAVEIVRQMRFNKSDAVQELQRVKGWLERSATQIDRELEAIAAVRATIKDEAHD